MPDADRAISAESSKTSESAQKAKLAETSTFSNESINSTFSANSGFTVGGFSMNASFRDSYPSGGSPNAISLEEIDARTVRLTTNFSADKIGSRYRGIYWKITYEKLEDLKGKWLVKCNYTGYQSSYINCAIQDWGSMIDMVKLSTPIGNNKITTYDLYNLIIDYKNAHQEDGKWTGILETQGYLYVQFIDYHSTGMCDPFDDVLTLDFVSESTRVIATELSDELSDKIDKNIEDKIQDSITGNTTNVTNWGDSLTAGAGSSDHTHQETILNAIKEKGYPDLDLTATENITYSIMMQKLLGSKYKVTNCGVGGENINTIAARLGANVAYATEDFILPQDETPVQISTYDSKLNSAWGVQISPLLQGEGNSVNPCYVQGIECTLKWTGSDSSDQRVFILCRELRLVIEASIFRKRHL